MVGTSSSLRPQEQGSVKISADEYDEVVARLYDAGAGRIDWRHAFAPLAERFELWSIALFGLARHNRDARFVCEGGLSGPEFALDYLRVYHRIDPHIGPALALGCERGEWVHCQDRFDDDFIARDPFYQEFLLPRGGRYTSCAKLLDGEDVTVLLLMQRGRGRPPLAEADIALFDRLRRHLVAALRLHLERRDRLTADVAIACRIFGRMRQALVLTDEELRIVYRNPAAQRLLARANAFSERNGHLVCRNRDDESRLRIAIRAVVSGAEPASASLEAPESAVIRVVGSGFINPVMVLATGLPSVAEALATGQPRAMLLLHETARRRQIDPVVIGEVFQLTPAEAEVATGLAEGLSIEEIAAARGVALETVRAQIRAVYGKTDVRSRADLVRMLLEMPSFDQVAAVGKPR